MIYYIPYLIIFLGLIFLLLILLSNYEEQKVVTTKFIDKKKYFNSMNILFSISGCICIILGSLSLFKVLPINILTTVFLPNITTLYGIKMLSITKKYGQPKE